MNQKIRSKHDEDHLRCCKYFILIGICVLLTINLIIILIFIKLIKNH